MPISYDTYPTPNLRLITPGASELVPSPAGLYIATGGTISITNQDGTTEATVPVATGTTIPIQPKKITAASSAVVYGLYYS